MEEIFLLLGSNIGDRKENLMRAIQAITVEPMKILKKSKIYQTKPWGVTNQPDYLNLALKVESDLSALELLKVFKRIERQMGRKRSKERWQPRVIDIDILFWGQHVVDRAVLRIPHEEFLDRPFAIKILAEIAPDFIPPGSKKTLRELSLGGRNEGIEIYRD